MMAKLRAALSRVLGADIAEVRDVAGGDINTALDVRLADGRRVFVKTNEHAAPHVFATEARGLSWLRESRAVRVPEVLAVADGEAGDPAFLVLEFLEAARPAPDFDERLGRSLAELHRGNAPCFGLDHDNYIGSLPQANGPEPSWAEFYWRRRLEPQLELARARGRVDSECVRRSSRLASKLGELLGPLEPPARLHGDLWSGNVHGDEQGRPVLVDPAVYGGHREMDLAMLRLFGGVSERAFSAYHERFPVAAGHEERRPLCQLYPLLVHANLFGGSYVEAATRIVARFA